MPKLSKFVHEWRARSRRGSAARNSPRLASIASEVLAKNAEEASDVVFYDERKPEFQPPQDYDKALSHHEAIQEKPSSTEHNSVSTNTDNEDNANNNNNNNNNNRMRLRRSGTITQVPVTALRGEEQEPLAKDSAPTIPRARRYSLSSFYRVLSFGPAAKKLSQLNELILDPEGNRNYVWMGILSLAVFYNFFVVILRIAFTEMRETAWFRLIDLVADSLYALDIGVQLRTAYHDDHGILVEDRSKLMMNYMKQKHFIPDIIAVLPVETLLRWTTDPFTSLLCRLLRLLKLRCVVRFFFLSDYRTNRPNRLRVLKLILYLGLALHWVACFYYMISEYEGLGTNDWVYSESQGQEDHFTRKYIKSLYWSVLTLTTIGETPNPGTNLEYIFTGSMFLLGIFVFATVVGNVGDVISNMNAARTDFQGRMDAIKQYMEHHKVPDSVQNRVNRWAYYAWSRTQALDEGTSLGMLPERLRAEISIHVHLATLKKVKIFKDCEQGLLCELVLKLRHQIFSPGDYICRCGEIGRDMYIINHGKVEVVVQNSLTNEEIVVASLSEGNYFGEISLLRLNGGRNRRSADVRSVGYSELLCLSQKDLMEALEEYPDAKKVLESQGKDRLHRTKSMDHLFAPPSDKTPKHEELDFNFAREMKEMRNLLEEMRETMEQQASERDAREVLNKNCGVKLVTPPCVTDGSSHTTSQVFTKPESRPAEVLYQRLLRAAKSASENGREVKRRPFRKSVAVDGRLARERKITKKENNVREVPRICAESELDGVCNIAESRKVSMPIMKQSKVTKWLPSSPKQEQG